MSEASLYIDFERYHYQNIEVAAILTYEQKIISTFHQFIRPVIRDMSDYEMQAHYSHCIRSATLEYFGNPENLVKCRFIQWIQSFNFSLIIIKGHGIDVNYEALTKWIPNLALMKNLAFKQVELPPWIVRQNENYHQATYRMKTVAHSQLCHRMHHNLPMWKDRKYASNESKIARYTYGFHCAAFDCYELAFCDKAIPLFTCEQEFNQNVINRNISPYLNAQ